MRGGPVRADRSRSGHIHAAEVGSCLHGLHLYLNSMSFCDIAVTLSAVAHVSSH